MDDMKIAGRGRFLRLGSADRARCHGQRSSLGGVFFEESKLDLIVVGWLSPVNFRVALPADCEQVARQFLKHADVREVVDFGWWPLAALLALTVGGFENVLAPLAPEILAKVPVVSSLPIERS